MAKLTKEEFIDKVLTFNSGKNSYGYRIHNGTTIENGAHISVASKGTKLFTCITKGNNQIICCTIFNYANEEFHRVDEANADKYL
jgi:hypothetical protein